MKENKKDMGRREFLKRLGLGAAATTAALAGCDSKDAAGTGGRSAQKEIPTDKMTYRTNPQNGGKGVDSRLRLYALAYEIGQQCARRC